MFVEGRWAASLLQAWQRGESSLLQPPVAVAA
jgi:hypothetical protein